MNSSRDRPDRLVSIVLEDVVPDSVMRTVLDDDTFKLHFFAHFPGYAWEFPKGKAINVGIGVVIGEKKCLREMFEAFLSKEGLEYIGSKQDISSTYPISSAQ